MCVNLPRRLVLRLALANVTNNRAGLVHRILTDSGLTHMESDRLQNKILQFASGYDFLKFLATLRNLTPPQHQREQEQAKRVGFHTMNGSVVVPLSKKRKSRKLSKVIFQKSMPRKTRHSEKWETSVPGIFLRISCRRPMLRVSVSFLLISA